MQIHRTEKQKMFDETFILRNREEDIIIINEIKFRKNNNNKFYYYSESILIKQKIIIFKSLFDIRYLLEAMDGCLHCENDETNSTFSIHKYYVVATYN